MISGSGKIYMSLVADAPKSIKTMTIYSKYFAVAFDSIPGLILRIIPNGAYHIWKMQATYHRFDGIFAWKRG